MFDPPDLWNEPSDDDHEVFDPLEMWSGPDDLIVAPYENR